MMIAFTKVIDQKGTRWQYIYFERSKMRHLPAPIYTISLHFPPVYNL